MRRILTILLLLAITAAAVWMLLNWERRSSTITDPWQAVPQNSAIIISVPDAWSTWDRFTHTSQLWSAFEEIPSFAAAGRIMARTIDRMHEDASLREALENAPVLICLISSGGETGGLFIGTPNVSSATPLTAFSELMGLDEAGRNALLKGEVVQIRPDTALPSLSLCLRDRTWLMASSIQVMDEALLQLKERSQLLQDSLFLAARGTVGSGADAHVLVDLHKASRLTRTWFNAELIEQLHVPAGWIAMDVRTRSDAMLMSGLLAPAGLDPVLEQIRSQGIGRIDVKRVLPASVCAMEIRHVSDPSQEFEEEGKTHLANALFNWVDGSVGHAWAAKVGGGTEEWAFFQANDAATAREAIMSLSDTVVDPEQQEYRGNIIQRLPLDSALIELFGDRYKSFIRPWWTILGDVVVYSQEIEALQSSINAWNDGNSLAVEPRATEWDKQISSSFGRMFWCDIARGDQLIGSQLDPAVRADWDELAGFKERIGVVSMQISPGQRGYYHVVVGVQHAPLEHEENGLLWETEIGARVDRIPSIVRNHNNNTNEVLVQDVNNTIHLIGSTGRLLWSRKLDAPIMGNVHQVDRFRNGKLQLLFNTSERLYLIDRNGKDVGAFPVRLHEQAVVPIAVFDYETDRNYRILVATNEGRILNYGLDGIEIKGWDPPEMNASAACPVHHLRIKNKDYLIIADVTGRLHIFDRRGEIRERTALALGASPEIRSIRPGTEVMTSTVIWTDTAGVLQQGSLDGPVVKLSAGDSLGSFSAMDVDGDDELELVRTQADTLTISRNGEQIFQRTFGMPIAPQINVLDLGKGGPVIGIARPEADLISLLDTAGRDLPNTPLSGRTAPVVIDLNLDRIPEVITVTGEGKVVAYSIDREK